MGIIFPYESGKRIGRVLVPILVPFFLLHALFTLAVRVYVLIMTLLDCKVLEGKSPISDESLAGCFGFKNILQIVVN